MTIPHEHRPITMSYITGVGLTPFGRHEGASSVARDYHLYFMQVKDPPALIHLGEKWQ